MTAVRYSIIVLLALVLGACAGFFQSDPLKDLTDTNRSVSERIQTGYIIIEAVARDVAASKKKGFITNDEAQAQKRILQKAFDSLTVAKDFLSAGNLISAEGQMVLVRNGLTNVRRYVAKRRQP